MSQKKKDRREDRKERECAGMENRMRYESKVREGDECMACGLVKTVMVFTWLPFLHSRTVLN